MSKSHSCLNLKVAVPAPSIAPYFPFARVKPVDQVLTTDSRGNVVKSRIILASDPRRVPVCSGRLGPTRSVHGTTIRSVRDLPLAGARTELLVPVRKLRCPRCGIRNEHHEFLAPYRRSTVRFERAVADLARVLSLEHVARHFGLDWDTVKDIDKRRLTEEVGSIPSYDGLRLLAVDEFAVRRRWRARNRFRSALSIQFHAPWEGRSRARPGSAVR